MTADENLEKGRRKSRFCLTHVNNRVHPCGKTEGRDAPPTLSFLLGDGGAGGVEGVRLLLSKLVLNQCVLFHQCQLPM